MAGYEIGRVGRLFEGGEIVIRGQAGKWARWQGTRALHARGHGDTGTRGDTKIHGCDAVAPLSDTTNGQLGSAAPTNSLCNKGAGGGLAPELINIDHVFANAGDGDF